MVFIAGDKTKNIFLLVLFSMFLFSTVGAASFKLFQSISATLNFQQSVLSIGNNETVTASVSGGYPPYLYEWSVNGQPVGRDSRILTFNGNSSTIGYSNVTLTVIDQYNNIANVTNYIYVQNPNFFTAYVSPNNQAADFGQNITMKVSVSSGSAPYTYNWNFIPLSGAQITLPCDTYTCTFSATQDGSVQVTVIDSLGRVTSAISKVTVVGSPLTVKASPYVTNDAIRSQQTLYATAKGGSGTYTYMWYNNTNDQQALISNSNSNTLTLNLFTAGHFQYYVMVYDSAVSNSKPVKSNLVYINVGSPTTQIPQQEPSTTLTNPICNTITLSQGTYNTTNVYSHDFKVAETLLTKDGASVSVNNISYFLGVGQSVNIGQINDSAYSIKLVNISGYTQLTSQLLICGSAIKVIQPSARPQINTTTYTGVPEVQLNVDNVNNNYYNVSYGTKNTIYASTNFGLDKVALFANNDLIATGIGNITYSTSLMQDGTYNLVACDVTSYPQQCSSNVTLKINSPQQNNQGFSISGIKLPIPPLYIVGIVVIIIVAYLLYRRRSDDYDYMYSSKENDSGSSYYKGNNGDTGSSNGNNGDDHPSTSNGNKPKMKESEFSNESPISLSKKSVDSYESNNSYNDKIDWSAESKE
jgi:hypothetical protein